jgi:hypothetical protein
MILNLPSSHLLYTQYILICSTRCADSAVCLDVIYFQLIKVICL